MSSLERARPRERDGYGGDMVIAIGGPPGDGVALFLAIVAILISVAVLAEALGRRETRRDDGRVSDQ
jgi:hypothetical protein